MKITVKELINYISGKLTGNNLLQVYVYRENYCNDDIIKKIETVLNEKVIDFDIWTKEEFKDMFCDTIERVFIESKFTDSTRFLTIKIKWSNHNE
ncbi:MAG: hypothetical protein IKG27_05705 [Bacilli bacterium]|nr:hypothetical protein [Bacilli bacterium]